MPAQGSRHATHAFSLAELMIALVILGLGLLFIAAALPVGLDYTRQTVDRATGEAAGQFALSQLELNLRTSGDDLYEPSLFLLSVVHRLDNIHRPRDQTPFMPPKYLLQPTYEPVIKVRPLALGNIGMSRVGSDPQARGAELVDDTEGAIGVYLENFLSDWGIILSLQTAKREYDFAYSAGGLETSLSLVTNPVLPGMARVYPPVEPVTTFSVANFYGDDRAYPTYASRVTTQYQPGTLTPAEQLRERQKALDRRVAWTAFYRRLSYKGDPGSDGIWFAPVPPPPTARPDDIAEAPLLYELIVVVTRRTTVNHRFPRQDLSAANLATFETPAALSSTTSGDPVGVDRLAPTPWLVTFDSNQGINWVSPQLTMNADYAAFIPDPANNPFYMERVLQSSFNDPPTLTFRCTPEVGALLPVGSVFIPAVNDQRYGPAVLGVRPRAGFVPSAPQALPIYEIVERPDDTTVVVKNNGHYPWLADPLQSQLWPVWVIPPAFAERDSNGQPVYERTSPIVAVVRRTVTLREVRP